MFPSILSSIGNYGSNQISGMSYKVSNKRSVETTEQIIQCTGPFLRSTQLQVSRCLEITIMIISMHTDGGSLRTVGVHDHKFKLPEMAASRYMGHQDIPGTAYRTIQSHRLVCFIIESDIPRYIHIRHNQS